MKFRLSFTAVLALAAMVSLSSCYKNYTCHCDIVYSGYPALPDSTSKEYSIKDSQSGATSKCKAESGSYNNNGVQSTETCYIY